MKKPLILIVNDDGITTPGIRRLIDIMNNLGDVVVVAPDKPQSGKSHSISLNTVIRCSPFVFDNGPQKEYACSGTPVDCVKLAFNKILHRKPDLCVSGINHGSNSSINVVYSGTMSAAIEASISGVPSIGFSLLDYSIDADFSECSNFISDISLSVLKSGLPEGVSLNVNIPKSVRNKSIKGIKICKQSKAKWIEEFDEREDPFGRKYYWLTGDFVDLDSSKDTDEYALKNHYISIVPIKFDLTSYESISEIKTII
tara:strand:+ start:663 stop:1430 length:768 start_codon:yes stop_codon:yes gene_type:complete